MNVEHTLALLALTRVPNLGNSSIKKLVEAVGSPEGIFEESPKNLLKIEGIGSQRIKGLHQTSYRAEAERELAFMNENTIAYQSYWDTAYPEQLRYCTDAPVLLFSRGKIDIASKKILSIVGTRQCTKYGAQFCEDFITALAPLNPVIVSGLAYGIDIAAHRTAIGNELQTIACLAHGLNQLYPRSHKKYSSAIESNGGFFTEYWSTDTFDRKNFLGRNRIIAGLSEATIVIESATKGGALVTANLANSYHREVFAVPGRVGDEHSAGCHRLIQTQQAHLLTSAEDLIHMLNWDLEVTPKSNIQKQIFIDLTPEEQKIHAYLKHHGKTLLDQLALECRIPTHKIAALLLGMELKSAVQPLPGKYFQAV